MADTIESVEVAPEMPDLGTSGARLGEEAQAPNVGNVFQGQQQAVDIDSIYREILPNVALSPEGERYISEIRKIVDERGPRYGVQLVELTHPAGTLAAVAKNNAIVLIFDEEIHQDAKLPTANQTKAALQSLQSQCGNSVTMRECIIVHPSDYSKSAVMATWLINTLFCLNNESINAITVRSFQNIQLEISTNRADYENFQMRYNPHGTLDRADLTITVYTAKRKQHQVSNADYFWRDAEVDRQAYGTIGAYVKFLWQPDDRGQYKYQPVICISQLTARVPNPSSIPLLLSVATDLLIDKKYWKRQFLDFGDNKPNIGNLMVVPNADPKDPKVKNGRFMATDPNDVDYVIANCCHPNPSLILEVVDGRARIPGLEQFEVSPEHGGWANVIRNTNKFLGGNVIAENICPCKAYYHEYVGLMQEGLKFNHSRYIDFLNMMVHHSNDARQCEKLLQARSNGDEFIQLLFEFMPGNQLKALYTLSGVVLQSDLIRPIQGVVHDAIRTIDNQIASGVVDLSGMIAAAEGFQQTAMGGYYSGLAMADPFNRIYGTSGMQTINWG